MSLRPESWLTSICLRKQAGREEFTTLTLGKSGLISRSSICRLTDNQQRMLSTVTSYGSGLIHSTTAVGPTVLLWRWREGTYRKGSPEEHNRKPPATTWIWPVNSVGLFPVLSVFYKCKVSHQMSRNRHWDSSKANLRASPLTLHSGLVIRTIICHLLFPSMPCSSVQLFFLVACSTTLTCVVWFY